MGAEEWINACGGMGAEEDDTRFNPGEEITPLRWREPPAGYDRQPRFNLSYAETVRKVQSEQRGTKMLVEITAIANESEPWPDAHGGQAITWHITGLSDGNAKHLEVQSKVGGQRYTVGDVHDFSLKGGSYSDSAGTDWLKAKREMAQGVTGGGTPRSTAARAGSRTDGVVLSVDGYMKAMAKAHGKAVKALNAEFDDYDDYGKIWEKGGQMATSFMIEMCRKGFITLKLGDE